MKLTLMLVAASILIFIGIFAAFPEAGLGTFDLQALYAAGERQLRRRLPEDRLPAVRDRLPACLAGLWPFHTWSPDGHVVRADGRLDAARRRADEARRLRHPPPRHPAAARGRRVLDARPDHPGDDQRRSTARSRPWRRRDFKYMIGYSSVSHMGYVLMGLATLNADRHQRRRAADVLARRDDGPLVRHGRRRLRPGPHARDDGSSAASRSKMPLFAVFFVIAGLTSLGLTGLLRLRRRVQHLRRHVPDVPVGRRARRSSRAGITAVYIFRMLALSFFGPFNESAGAACKDMTHARARRRRAAHRLHPLHGPLAGAVRRPHRADRAQLCRGSR